MTHSYSYAVWTATHFSSLCQWAPQLTAFSLFSDPFLHLHLLNWHLKEKLCFFFWFSVMQYFNMRTVPKIKVLVLFILKYIVIPSKQKHVSS